MELQQGADNALLLCCVEPLIIITNLFIVQHGNRKKRELVLSHTIRLFEHTPRKLRPAYQSRDDRTIRRDSHIKLNVIKLNLTPFKTRLNHKSFFSFC